MTISQVGAGLRTDGTGASMTLAYNQSPTAGNLLVAGVFITFASMSPVPTCSTPAGWTAGPGATWQNAFWNNVCGFFTFYKIATGGDAAPVFTTTNNIAGSMLSEEWANTLAWAPSPVDYAPAGSNSYLYGAADTAVVTTYSPTITTTAASDLIWTFAAGAAPSGNRTPLTWAGGSTGVTASYSGNTLTLASAKNLTTPAAFTPALTWGQPASVPLDNVGMTSIAFKSANQAPNAPTLNSPATGTTVDLGVTQRLAWTVSDPDPGDSQSAFSLRYRIGTGAWTTVTGTTPNAYWDAPPSTFSAASYEWQVNTTDALGLTGPNSASSFFTAASTPGVPSITAPTSGSTIVGTSATVSWSVGTQTDYQVRKVADNAGAADTATIYYDSGDVVDASTRSVSLAFPTNNRWEHIQVRVKAAGLWSTWADDRVYVSWTAPMTPTLTATPNSGTASIAVAITNPAPTGGAPAVAYNDVFVSSSLDTEYRAATQVATNGTWTWKTPGAGRVYTIRVVAIGTNGTQATSV